eukprot:652023-Rhodomonas_salina.1
MAILAHTSLTPQAVMAVLAHTSLTPQAVMAVLAPSSESLTPHCGFTFTATGDTAEAEAPFPHWQRSHPHLRVRVGVEVRGFGGFQTVGNGRSRGGVELRLVDQDPDLAVPYASSVPHTQVTHHRAKSPTQAQSRMSRGKSKTIRQLSTVHLAKGQQPCMPAQHRASRRKSTTIR